MLLTIAASLLFPGKLGAIVLVAGLFMALLQWIRQRKAIYRQYAQLQENLSGELYAFTAYVEQTLSTQRNVLRILEGYRLTENTYFSRELEITLADMRSSSYENGLLSLGRRVGNTQLDLIIQGLLAVNRGEEQQYYFALLVHDLETAERARLKRKVNHLGDQLSPYMLLLLLSSTALLLVPVVITIMDSFRQYFNS